MKPPAPAIPSTLVEKIIFAHKNDGISFAELQSTSAVWPDELARMLYELRSARLIETRANGRIYPAKRRKKQVPAKAGFFARLRAVLAP